VGEHQVPFTAGYEQPFMQDPIPPSGLDAGAPAEVFEELAVDGCEPADSAAGWRVSTAGVLVG
jgi:hypothetical protein